MVCLGLAAGCGDSSGDSKTDGSTREDGGSTAQDAERDARSPPPELPDCGRDAPRTPPPECGSGDYDWQGLLRGPGGEGYDAELAAKARRIDRQAYTFSTAAMGVSLESKVSSEENRADVKDFLQNSDSWDFESHAGRPALEAIESWEKTAGAYAGVAVAADAFRYGTLRDQGAPCDAVERARQQLLEGLDGLHRAVEITGVEGVIARGYARTDLPGTGQRQETIPLFDEDGTPLPEEKGNGSWREDNSPDGQYPNYIWHDSCSRDQYIGWVMGFAAAWEVIRRDPSIPEQMKSRLQQDAEELARGLMEVQDSGYDLEIRDADGRRTLHGIMNEHGGAFGYLEDLKNGFFSMMSLGIVAALAYVAEEPDIDHYLYDELVYRRRLHEITRDHFGGVHSGVRSNFSNYNMAFVGGWLATRYLCRQSTREVMRTAVDEALYDVPGKDHQPAEQKQTLYDFVYVASSAGATAWSPADGELDMQALSNGLQTLREYQDAPVYQFPRNNCDEQEIEAGVCHAEDGTRFELRGHIGHGDTLVADEPVPMRLRPSSNYYWRSNPYEVNGGGNENRLLPAYDFRVTYWMARWIRR